MYNQLQYNLIHTALNYKVYFNIAPLYISISKYLEQLILYIGNEIVNVNGLRALTNLKYLDLDNSRMNDLSAIDYLKAKGCLKENCLINSLQKPSQQEIDEARLW
ncbi:Leucine-rich_repeat domain superfamily [Hexamita inflata]|uniref:Leucine-rich repeat domain superfamily n=1 Tax=Hexamita inflata TaxID=28002 RepID=A0AA86NYS6_9EUKA|nr:Leucine-rich repeat domain superfamily [Hexamita inflata]